MQGLSKSSIYRGEGGLEERGDKSLSPTFVILHGSNGLISVIDSKWNPWPPQDAVFSFVWSSK